jgi:hypothetical protein
VRRTVVSTSSETQLEINVDGDRVVRRGGQRWLHLASDLVQLEALVRAMLNLRVIRALQNR